MYPPSTMGRGGAARRAQGTAFVSKQSSLPEKGNSTDSRRVPPQDVILQNKHLWLLIKACFGYQSNSQYRKQQRMLQRDPNWPPVNAKDLAAKSTDEIYINPTYEHSKED